MKKSAHHFRYIFAIFIALCFLLSLVFLFDKNGERISKEGERREASTNKPIPTIPIQDQNINSSSSSESTSLKNYDDHNEHNSILHKNTIYCNLYDYDLSEPIIPIGVFLKDCQKNEMNCILPLYLDGKKVYFSDTVSVSEGTIRFTSGEYIVVSWEGGGCEVISYGGGKAGVYIQIIDNNQNINSNLQYVGDIAGCGTTVRVESGIEDYFVLVSLEPCSFSYILRSNGSVAHGPSVKITPSLENDLEIELTAPLLSELRAYTDEEISNMNKVRDLLSKIETIEGSVPESMQSLQDEVNYELDQLEEKEILEE
jgi:hypothetical protein